MRKFILWGWWAILFAIWAICAACRVGAAPLTVGTLTVSSGQISITLDEPVNAVAFVTTCNALITRDPSCPFQHFLKDGDCENRVSFFWNEEPIPPGTYDLATGDGCPLILRTSGLLVNYAFCTPIAVEPSTWSHVKGLWK